LLNISKLQQNQDKILKKKSAVVCESNWKINALMCGISVFKVASFFIFYVVDILKIDFKHHN
jgi:hypothetical protein